MIKLDDLQVFVQVVQAGSFSRAARQYDMTPAFVSNSVSRLERELDVRLFVRTTRSLRLSEEGERYLPHAQTAIEAIFTGDQALATGRCEMVGTLRLSAPADFGRNILLGWLDEFQDRYPRLTINLSISDHSVDLLGQPIDAAVRYGVLADSGLVAHPLVPQNRRSVCAAPAYLARHGTPANVQELQSHNCLRFFWGDQTLERWQFHLPTGVEKITVQGDRVSDNADLVRLWALAGRGIIYRSRLDLLPDIRAGRLVEIFPPEQGESVPLNFVCAHRSLMTPAIIRLRDYLRERCEALQLGSSANTAQQALSSK